MNNSKQNEQWLTLIMLDLKYLKQGEQLKKEQGKQVTALEKSNFFTQNVEYQIQI